VYVVIAESPKCTLWLSFAAFAKKEREHEEDGVIMRYWDVAKRQLKRR